MDRVKGPESYVCELEPICVEAWDITYQSASGAGISWETLIAERGV